MFIEVNTTCGTEEEARCIVRHAVEQHLCACAHILPVESYYWWNGSIFKTASAQYERLSELIITKHSYDPPPIYTTPIERCSKAYAQ